jgi:hypothetical protein
MKELWKATFELFRRHLVLWVPCLIAVVLTLVLGKLETAGIHLLLTDFGTQRSALGGLVPSTDPARVQQLAMMIVTPVGLLKQFLEVCLFVAALTATKSLVQTILEEKRPDMAASLHGIRLRYPEVLLLSIKYMAMWGVLGGMLVVLASSPLTSERFHEFALSKVFVNVFGLLSEGCVAWLLVPATIRLLRAPGSPVISSHERRIGVVFAVASAAASLALQFLIGKAETTLVLDLPWEGEAVAVVNAVFVNMPNVMLFITLSLLAIQGANAETSLAGEDQAEWSDPLSD